MRYTVPLFLIMSGCAGSNIANKLQAVVSTVVPSPSMQDYNKYCKEPVDKIVDLESRVGSISKDNLKSYEQAWLGLDRFIGLCANVDTTQNADLQARQKEAVDKMYQTFITKHLIVDEFGQSGSFSPATQNLFVVDSPFIESHYVCQPESMGEVDELINKSWLTVQLVALEKTIKGKTPLVDFENQVADDHEKYVARAKKKSDDCLAQKLDEIRAYTNAAPASVINEWKGTVRLEFSNHTDLEISRIVFPYAKFRRVKETTREIENGTIREYHQDYDVTDAYVYVINGEFVDAYLVACYKDYIKNEEYARFFGTDANNQLRVSQRLLLKNF